MHFLRWVISLFSKPTPPHKANPVRVRAGQKAAETHKRRVKYMEAIELVSDLLSVKQYKSMRGQGGSRSYSGFHHAKPRDFNYIEPIIIAEAMPEFYPDINLQTINAGTTLQELERPLDYSMIRQELKEEGEEWAYDADADGKAVFSRMRHVSKNQVRGRVRVYMPYMVENRTVFVDRFRRHGESVVFYYGSADLEEWFHIGVSQSPGSADQFNNPRQQPFTKQLRIVSGFAKSREDKWIVGLQRSNQPAMAFPTDPIGVREIFRLRDIPEGKARRASMIHWVDAHYRKKHDDPSALTYVRKHLRGGTRFTWNGLICTVKPPRSDAAFSERPDLIDLRSEGIAAPKQIAVEDIPPVATAADEEELKLQIEMLRNGTAETFRANRKGSWVGIRPKN